MTMRRALLGLAIALAIGTAPQAQTAGSVYPFVKPQFFTDAGAPCNGCKLYTYLTGTVTPEPTYSDSGLTTPNANPIVLDSAGRATIYLANKTYKFVLKTSADVTIWTQDEVSSVGLTLSGTASLHTCDGRITLTSGTPVTTSDVTAATTVYFTPYKGARCTLYTSSVWTTLTFTEASLALGSDTADTNYDLFAYSSGGVLTLERLAWSSATARATSLTTLNGVLVKSTDTSRRYLGTYRTSSVAGQTVDSARLRFVWNYLHRVRRSLRVTDSTDSWTYTLGTLRPANNTTDNRVEVVVGVAESLVDLRAFSLATNSGTTTAYTAIGEDSTSAAATGCIMIQAAISSAPGSPNAHLTRFPAIGYHYYSWLEASSASGTTTWYGDSGTPLLLQNGMTGTIDG